MNSLFAKRIYTGKSVLENAHVVFDKKSIVSVSKAKKGPLLGEYEVITPAFIDPHSHIGMVRAGEPSNEAEANERMDTILALADALDSVHMDDQALRDAVEMGVLYSCVVPGSGNIIGGRSAVIRNFAPDSSSALVARRGLKAAFGYNPMSTQKWEGTRPSTRMGALALLRKRLDEVMQKMERQKKAKGKKREEITFSAEDAILRDLLRGKLVLRAHVHKTDDVAVVLRLADAYGLKICIEHAMDICEPATFRELKRRKIPVTYGPLDAFAYKVELKHASWRNIVHLLESTVDFGLMTDHPVTPAASLFLQTRWFTRFGLSKQNAIEIVSRKNAEILGVSDRLGTLAKNKWASFICWNGDPFDVTHYPVAVYGEGECLFEAS